MSMIATQIAGQKRPSDNGLLERVENELSPSNHALLALLSRVSDILEKNDYLNERMEDDHYAALTALDTLTGKMSEAIYEDETGITEENQRENAIRDRHDYNRKSEAA